MKQYLDELRYVLEHGTDRIDRTKVGTRTVFARRMEFDLSLGFPILTSKLVAFGLVKKELLWFLRGSRDITELQKQGCYIWDANAYAPSWLPKAEFPGDVGIHYGVHWRAWRSAYSDKTLDQIAGVIRRIKKDPSSRRLIVTAWDPATIGKTALPPCHMFFQFFVDNGFLSMQMYQRSCDMFLGVPFNISSYCLLLSMIAQVIGLKPGRFIHILGDTHIYLNHVDQVREQLSRGTLPLPSLALDPKVMDIDAFTLDDLKLENYQHHSAIKAPMAV
ncbi:MAG: thymidylate synthase [Patescibacteria group bacterium]